jgi:hypothetical protein
VFSFSTFLTNWTKLSPEAKTQLFTRPEWRRDLEQVASAASNVRDGSKVFANNSGTSPSEALIRTGATIGGSMVSLLTGHPMIAASALSAPVTANAMTRLMVNPKFVKWLAESTKAPREQLPAQINALAQFGADGEALSEALNKQVNQTKQ